jgi:hypothetical protein
VEHEVRKITIWGIEDYDNDNLNLR